MSIVLSEHLPLLASAPDGIQKLRGLILELAVRGKLVPQDSADEPASELLKRIEQERARQEAAGICKKLKAIPLEKDSWPFELPISWEWCRLPDVANYKMGKTPPTKEATYWADDGIPWVSISDMSHGQRIVTTSRTISNAACEKVFRSVPVPAGTLLMSFKLTVGKVATLGIDAFHNEAIISIFPFTGVSQDFLTHFLPLIAQGGNSKSALMGDTLNSESLARLCVPLPPLAEQHRIVAKVDELMALCDRLEAELADAASAHARLVETLLGTLTQSTDAADLAANWQRLAERFDTLFTTEASIDALKQTVLQLAVMGKLVPQDLNDKPASDTLNLMVEERVRLEKNGVRKKSKPTSPVVENEMPFQLPSGWKWVSLGEVVEIKGGKRVSNGYQLSKTPTPYIYIRVSDMKNGSIDDSDLHYIDEAMRTKIQQYIITKDDIYMTIVGATIGKCGLVPEKFDGMNLTENAARLILSPVIDRVYLYKCLASDFCQKQFFDKTKQVGVQKMALNRLAMTAIPLPPLAEQYRIVGKVDKLMALCEHLQAGLAYASQHQAKLADTLIDSALEAA